MSTTDQPSNLPAQITAAVAGIPAALVPVCIKALDRLIGAAVDIPVAWLEYHKAKIVSQTEAFRTIDSAITVKAATKAGSNEQFADRALDNLVRKSYRQLDNKEAVSAAMLEDLRDIPAEQEPNETTSSKSEPPPIDDDWLNVFERYAEDASTDRMQKLWGRVLAGEIRKPGRYGMRTLRFLSEFSQADAIAFSDICKNAFGGIIPKRLATKPGDDLASLFNMEAAGLIIGATTGGLTSTLSADPDGQAFLLEDSLCLMFSGEPNGKLTIEVYNLTPLGKELVTLLPERDVRSAARTVGLSIKRPGIKAGYIMTVVNGTKASPLEVLWQEGQSIFGGAF